MIHLGTPDHLFPNCSTCGKQTENLYDGLCADCAQAAYELKHPRKFLYVYVRAYCQRSALMPESHEGAMVSFVSTELWATDEDEAYSLGNQLLPFDSSRVALNDYVHQIKE